MNAAERSESHELGQAQRQVERTIVPGESNRAIVQAVLLASRDHELAFRSFQILEAWALRTFREEVPA